MQHFRKVFRGFLKLWHKPRYRVRPLYFFSLDYNQERVPSVPLVVHQKLIGFVATEIKIVMSQSSLLSVLLCKNSLSADMFLTENYSLESYMSCSILPFLIYSVQFLHIVHYIIHYMSLERCVYKVKLD